VIGFRKDRSSENRYSATLETGQERNALVMTVSPAVRGKPALQLDKNRLEDSELTL